MRRAREKVCIQQQCILIDKERKRENEKFFTCYNNHHTTYAVLDVDTTPFAGYSHNPYNGVVCNDIILATGVFSSKELWKLSKGN